MAAGVTSVDFKDLNHLAFARAAAAASRARETQALDESSAAAAASQIRETQLRAALDAALLDAEHARVIATVGPGRYSSPYHGMPSKSTAGGSQHNALDDVAINISSARS